MVFEIGKLVITKGVGIRMNENADFAKFVVDSFYDKYRQGDWGDICSEDKKMNDRAVKCNDDRIVARYNDIYVITEYDRSYTTILLISEY